MTLKPSWNFYSGLTEIFLMSADGVKDTGYSERQSLTVDHEYTNPGGAAVTPVNTGVSSKVWYTYDDAYLYFYITTTAGVGALDFKLDPDPQIGTPSNLNTSFNPNSQTDGHMYFRINANGSFENRTGGAKASLLNSTNLYYNGNGTSGYAVELRWPRAYPGSNPVDSNSFKFAVVLFTADSNYVMTLKPSWNYYSGLTEIVYRQNGIDGYLDGSYNHSFDVNKAYSHAGVPITNVNNVTGKVYYSWDNDYLYFYVTGINATLIDLRIDPDPTTPVITDPNTLFQNSVNNTASGDTYIRVNADGSREYRASANKNTKMSADGCTYSAATSTGLVLEMKWSRAWSGTTDRNSFKFTVNLGTSNGMVAMKTNWTTYNGMTEISLPQSTESGDTSFCIDQTGLLPNTIYLITRPAIENLQGIMEQDAARLISSLQGLINRDFEKNRTALYISRIDQDSFWLDYLRNTGKLLEDMYTVNITSFDQFLGIFKNQLISCGMILWDTDVPATANAAATICGLDGYLPVKNDASPTGVKAKLLAMGVPVKQNLVGMFSGTGTIPDTGSIPSTGSAKCDVYVWAMHHYMSRCSNKYVAYVPDGAGCVIGNPVNTDCPEAQSAGGNCLYSHDYLIARRSFFFDLTPVNEIPFDDPNQPLGTDLQTFRAILQKRYDLAAGQIGQLIGFPPWWLKYTTHKNRGSLVPTTVEWITAQIFSSYNLAIEADAGLSNLTNASIYYKSPKTTQYVNNKPSTYPTYDPNKVYCLIYMGDYDSSAWLKYFAQSMWTDPQRGTVPVMWSFNPNLSDRVPMIFDYLYQNKLSTDYFAAGDSGAGYLLPTYLYQQQGVRDLPTGDQQWADYCIPYMKRNQLDITGFILNADLPIDNNIMDLYNKISPAGNIHHDPARLLTIYKGTPYAYMMCGVGDPKVDVTTRANQIYDKWNTIMNGKKLFSF